MFEIQICSDLEHEEIVADVNWNSEILATINQDKGLNNLEIELFSPTTEDSWILPFDKLIDVLLEAKATLHKMQKYPD